MAAWPSTLPDFFQVGGYSEKGVDNTLRSKMDVGPDKLRRRTITNVRNVIGNMWLTDSQYDDMVTFYETTQNYGADSFTMDDAHAVNKTWRFVGPPSYSTVGPNNWQVRLTLEEMP